MKVLLINPPISKEEVYAKYSVGAPSLPPLGLCYLAAMLLKEGFEVRILDCTVEGTTLAQLRDRVEEYAPAVVGVTSTTVSYPVAREVLRVVKEVDRGIKTILGGAHISAIPLQTMEECDCLDIGVIGEGEYTLVEIVRRLADGQPLTRIKGTLLRQNGQVLMNEPRPPITNLDEIPFPARHLLRDLRLYSHTPFRGAKFTTTMITSRGCPFSCRYCDQSIFGRRWRTHSPGYVISEISFLRERYGVDFISFEDDNFLLSKRRVESICRKMIEGSLNVGWSCLGRANEVDEEILPLMREAGCKNIYIGIESGSPRILKLINKRISIEETRRGIELIKRFGINVTGSFILGLPTETKEEIEETIDLALSLPLDGVSFFMFTPYPNTELRDLALQHGRVSEDWKDYSGHPGVLPFVPDGLSEDYLLKTQARAYRRFLLRPGYLIKHMGNFASRRVIGNGFKFLKAIALSRDQ